MSCSVTMALASRRARRSMVSELEREVPYECRGSLQVEQMSPSGP